MSGAIWGAVAQGALQLADTWMQSSAAHKANRTNIRLQREQQQWEERMSNTAIQRRAADIEAAGGNRALAFVNDSQASTPTVAPARVEPTYKGGASDAIVKGITAAMLSAQLNQMKATTELTTQQARVNKVEADNAERFGPKKAEWEANVTFEKSEQANLETAKRRIENDLTAAQLAKFREIWPHLVQVAANQAKEGKLNVDALERISSFGGVDATKLQPLIQILLRLIKD